MQDEIPTLLLLKTCGWFSKADISRVINGQYLPTDLRPTQKGKGRSPAARFEAAVAVSLAVQAKRMGMRWFEIFPMLERHRNDLTDCQVEYIDVPLSGNPSYSVREPSYRKAVLNQSEPCCTLWVGLFRERVAVLFSEQSRAESA